MNPPLKPYADYYETVQQTTGQTNCTQTQGANASFCRHYRFYGENCNNLNQIQVYSDANRMQPVFSHSVSAGVTTTRRLVQTNCSSQTGYAYNPGTENVILGLGALTLAIGITIMITIPLMGLIKRIPELWRRKS